MKFHSKKTLIKYRNLTLKELHDKCQKTMDQHQRATTRRESKKQMKKLTMFMKLFNKRLKRVRCH